MTSFLQNLQFVRNRCGNIRGFKYRGVSKTLPNIYDKFSSIFEKITNNFHPLTIFASCPVIDNWLVLNTSLKYELFSGILGFLFSESNSIPRVLVNLIKTSIFRMQHHVTGSETTCTEICKLWLTRCVYFSAYSREYR